jgi:hypothetical protein
MGMVKKKATRVAESAKKRPAKKAAKKRETMASLRFQVNSLQEKLDRLQSDAPEQGYEVVPFRHGAATGRAPQVGEQVGSAIGRFGQPISESVHLQQLGEAYRKRINESAVTVCRKIRQALGEAFQVADDCQVSINEQTGVVTIAPIIKTRAGVFG